MICVHTWDVTKNFIEKWSTWVYAKFEFNKLTDMFEIRPANWYIWYISCDTVGTQLCKFEIYRKHSKHRSNLIKHFRHYTSKRAMFCTINQFQHKFSAMAIRVNFQYMLKSHYRRRNFKSRKCILYSKGQDDILLAYRDSEINPYRGHGILHIPSQQVLVLFWIYIPPFGVYGFLYYR